MCQRVYLLFLVAAILGGCYPRQAHYDNDPYRPGWPSGNRVKFDFSGPRGNVPQARVVSFISIANPKLGTELVKLEAEAIVRHAAREGLPTSLLVSVIATESNFDPRAQSTAGAMGLGQLMPQTAAQLGVHDPFDPEENIRGTAKYLAWLSRYWIKNTRCWELTLASYLSGVGTVQNQMKANQDLTAEQAGYVRKIFILTTRV